HPHNVLASDFKKRRAILASGNFYVWNLTWADVTDGVTSELMACQEVVAPFLEKWAKLPANRLHSLPDPASAVRNGMRQLRAYIEQPSAPGWRWVASFAAFWMLQQTVTRKSVDSADLEEVRRRWRQGDPYAVATLVPSDDGDQVYGFLLPEGDDVVSTSSVADVMGNEIESVQVLGRLDDGPEATAEEDYKERWRRFLAGMNLYQFCRWFRYWTTSEAAADEAPELPELAPAPPVALSDAWTEVLEEVTPSLRSLVEELASRGVPVPETEHYHDAIDDDAFAELAWPRATPPVALLAGDQEGFRA
ncbi:MAG: helicase, partial [bacterium]|nr:helicase [bacterium]